MRILPIILLTLSLQAFGTDLSITTLNCYWFFNDENSNSADRPQTPQEYDLKAGHLIGLLPKETPILVALQEIGNSNDVAHLAYSATRRFNRPYQALFTQGKDSQTKQDVGAIFTPLNGWGIHGRPARHGDLEKHLSKHMVLTLTNSITSLHICIVHLRRPIGDDGIAKNQEQCTALLRWAMRHLSSNPAANVIILGDFNEGKPPGNPEQNLAAIFQARPPMFDPFELLSGKVRTHSNGEAYDRILISESIRKAQHHLRFKSITAQPHSYGKQARLYTDHFPVTLQLTELP